MGINELNTSLTVSWAAQDIPVFVVTEPDTVNVGDAFTVKLYSPHQHTLYSPYNGLGSKSVAPPDLNLVLDEVIDLSQTRELSTKYPVALVESITAGLPIVDVHTRAVTINAGASMVDYVDTMNCKLIIRGGHEMSGSVRVRYKTFDAQTWKHTAFSVAGSIVLFAHDEDTLKYTPVPIAISESGSGANDSIKIEAYPTTGAFTYTPYAHFVVLPARKKALVKVDYGTVERIGNIDHIVKREQISFSGTTANANFYIDHIATPFTGYFFDGYGNVIDPNFSVRNGVLVASVECYGTGFLSYSTKGTLYAYNAQVQKKDIPPQGFHYDITLGTVFAFDRQKKGIAASYEIPAQTVVAKDPIDFCTVTSKILVQEQTYEYPPNWSSDDNTYPSRTTGTLPVVGDPFLVMERTHAVGKMYAGETIDIDTLSTRWYPPFEGDPVNPDVVYSVSENIPEGVTDYGKQQIQEAIARIKEKFNVA